ncbi:MAG: hypothetical protein AAFQ45_07250 [Pseudomonadota bacterium]
MAVVIGLVLGWRVGYVAFFVAAVSQLLLYTVARAWILDVPAAFAHSPEEAGYLDSLGVFDVATIGLVALAIWLQRSSRSTTSG